MKLIDYIKTKMARRRMRKAVLERLSVVDGVLVVDCDLVACCDLAVDGDVLATGEVSASQSLKWLDLHFENKAKQ